MKHCLLRRLLGLVPLLLGISFLSFVLIQLSPGDPAEVAIRVNDQTPTPELLAEVRTQLGLDRPFPERYLRWLADVVRGDLGTSYVNGRPVAGELARALPPTLMLAGTAAVIMLACSLAVALVCVRHEGRGVDRLLRALLFLGTSVPAFWAGLLLIWLFSVHLDWLPTGGLEGPSSLVLPAVTLALPYLAAYARLLRNSMVQTAQEDFVLYARACRGEHSRHHVLIAFKTESLFLSSDVQMQLLSSRKFSLWGFSAGRQYTCCIVFNKAASVKDTMCKRLYIHP